MRENADIGLTRMLLGLYECAIAPGKYDRLTAELESLLTEEPDAQTLDALESHSGAIWEKAVDLFLDEADDPMAEDRVLDVAAGDAADRRALEAFMDRMPADDVARLTAFADGQGGGADILIRAEGAGQDRFEFHLARRRAGRIEVFRLRNDLAAEAEALLVSQFHISSSELQVLRGLVSGRALKEVAEETGKSIETIRTQTKSIAAKLGFSRQNEISAAVQSIARVAGSGRARRAADGLGTLTLRDGRSLSYSEAGDPDGVPVVFFHDFSSSCRWPDSVSEQFAAAGLRVISPSRAGFGTSDTNRQTQIDLFESHLLDYGEVIDQLGLEDARMLAFGTGFGLAHCLLRREPARGRWLVGINVYPPILSRRDAMTFPPGMYRAGSLAALYAPRTCSLISRYASRRAAAATSIEELDQLTGMEGPYGESERRFFTDFIQPNLQDVMQAKADGVWRDCTCLTIPWTDLYKRATPVRATILQNADFPFQPIERTRALAESLDLPFEVLDRPYRHFVDRFGDVLERLARGGPPNAPP